MPHLDEYPVVHGHLRPCLIELSNLCVHHTLIQTHCCLNKAVCNEPQNEVPVFERRDGSCGLADIDRRINGSTHTQRHKKLTSVRNIQTEGQARNEAGYRCVDSVVFSDKPSHKTQDKLVGRVEAHKEETELRAIIM